MKCKTNREKVVATQLPDISTVDHVQRRVALTDVNMVTAGTMKCLARAKNASRYGLSGTNFQLNYRETDYLAPSKCVECHG